MGRFIITEEERKRIRGLYEMVGDKLSPQSLQSPKAQNIKKQSLFLNQYYTMNLSSATTGSWTDKDFNDTLKKFMEEKGVPVHICKKGDGYCADADEGEVTTKEMGKLNQAMGFTQEDKSNKSDFIDLFSRTYGITEDSFSKINIVTGQTTNIIYQNIIMGSLKQSTIESARTPGRLDGVLSQLNKIYTGHFNLTELQKIWLGDFIKTLTQFKPSIEKSIQGLSEDEYEKLWRPLTYADGQTPVPTDEKINTTNDKGYDYKLSGGKYYYSPKGKNNWIESTGKGLVSIKQNVKFT